MIKRFADLRLHSKTEAARLLLGTLGIGGGDENSGVALAELGTRLGAALERAKSGGKLIEGYVIDENAPAAPAVEKFDL